MVSGQDPRGMAEAGCKIGAALWALPCPHIGHCSPPPRILRASKGLPTVDAIGVK